MKILVVDDELSDQMVVRRYLQTIGHEVILANTGKKAVDLYRNLKVDLVIMDIIMDELSGLDAAQWIRDIETGKPTPILFMSSTASQENLDKVSKVGGNGFIEKPINKVELQNLVAQLTSPDAEH